MVSNYKFKNKAKTPDLKVLEPAKETIEEISSKLKNNSA